jgi:hypothetical protein
MGSDDAHAHYAVAKHCCCFAYTDPLEVTRVLCVDDSDTEHDSGTDTKDVESFMPNFFSLLCR